MTKFLVLISLFVILDTVISVPATNTTTEDKTNTATEDKTNTTTEDKTPRADNKNETDEIIDEIGDAGWEYENTSIVDTRRILYSKRVMPKKRPYMVYLQLTKESAKAHKYRGWLCGGVIVDPSYVLTSAACVEDAEHFYIVSGTTKFVDSFDFKKEDCVCKNRRRVVWKCIPKNYKFDFQDSIKWSSNDIAIVKVDRPFKLGVLEKGCQHAAELISYNNVSRELEKPGTKGFICGWGSGNTFREGVYRRQETKKPENAKCLQEAKVCIMDNEQCAKKWAQKFRNIITQYMICTRDVMRRLSEICEKKYANCTDVEKRRYLTDEEPPSITDNEVNLDLGRHLKNPDDYTARRSSLEGGFCENDHGGPLLVKYQGKDRVVGVISACKIDPKTHSCHGPFLYTSVFKNRQFIQCAIHKDVEENCRRVFRTGITHEEYSVDWKDVEEDEYEGDRKDDDDRASASGSDEEKKSLRNNESKESTKTEKASEGDAPAEKEKSEKKEKKEKSKKKSKKKSKAKVQKANGEVFYESSKEDNVNEPDEE